MKSWLCSILLIAFGPAWVQAQTVTNGSKPTNIISPPRIQLQHAPLKEVLKMYGQLSKRTILHAELPQKWFTLDLAVTNWDEAAAALSKALDAQQILTIPDGKKFTIVVPASERATAEPRSDQITAAQSTNSKESPRLARFRRN